VKNGTFFVWASRIFFIFFLCAPFRLGGGGGSARRKRKRNQRMGPPIATPPSPMAREGGSPHYRRYSYLFYDTAPLFLFLDDITIAAPVLFHLALFPLSFPLLLPDLSPTQRVIFLLLTGVREGLACLRTVNFCIFSFFSFFFPFLAEPLLCLCLSFSTALPNQRAAGPSYSTLQKACVARR